MSTNKLQPEQIVDKNGILTTRNKKVGGNTASKRSAAIKPSVSVETASDNLVTLNDFIDDFSQEFSKREGSAADNREAFVVQDIAKHIEGSLNAIHSRCDDPKEVVAEMYNVLNETFDENKWSAQDSVDEDFRKSVNREFIIDATLILGGEPALLHPNASDL